MEPLAVAIYLAGSAVAVLTMLGALANRVRNETYVHNLMVETRRLRASYVQRLQMLAEEVVLPDQVEDLGQVDILD